MTADILATWRPSHVLMRGATERGKTWLRAHCTHDDLCDPAGETVVDFRHFEGITLRARAEGLRVESAGWMQ